MLSVIDRIKISSFLYPKQNISAIMWLTLSGEGYFRANTEEAATGFKQGCTVHTAEVILTKYLNSSIVTWDYNKLEWLEESQWHYMIPIKHV